MGEMFMDIKILYEDRNIIVCVKPAGILSEAEGMPAILKERTGSRSVYCVHRLDRDVSGIMVFAKTGKSAAELSAIIAEGKMTKEYLAVIHGCPEDKCGQMQDLLFHDRQKNKTYVVKRMRKGVKEAELSYTLLENKGDLSLVRVLLHTGRSHQIRVQFSSRKMPLAGDSRYGSTIRGRKPALWSYHIAFPYSGAEGGMIDISVLPEMETLEDDYKELFAAAFEYCIKQ